MEIIKAPNPVLSQNAKPVSVITKNILDLIEEMKTILLVARDPEGVGLAAPQIGKSLQIFIAKPANASPIAVFINPKVTAIQQTTNKKQQTAQKSNSQLEGCLSLQNIWGSVKRSPKVAITYLDEKGITHQKTISGFLAIIIQHEYDHLHGILFPKRVLEQKGKLYKSKKDKDGKDVFEEINL